MRLFQILILTLLCILLGGCAAFEHGRTYSKVKKQLLVANSGLGEKRLNIESRYDPTIKGFLEAAGKPNYIYVESQYKLKLIYLEESYVAEFDRSIFNTASSVEKINGIPESIMRKINHAKAYPQEEAFSFSD